MGLNSLMNNTTGYYNTAIGYNSLYNSTGRGCNTAVGNYSLFNNNTGYFNTAVGDSALFGITGSASYNNTAIGYKAGWTLTSGKNNTLIGFDAQPSSSTAEKEITLGNNAITTLRCNVGLSGLTSLSDSRDKTNINNLTLGLDFITKLQPRQFNWDRREWYEDNKSDGSKMEEKLSVGFIAQELDEVQQSENAEWLELVYKSNPEKLEATTGNLLPVMVNAIQELEKENNELKEKLAKFEETQSFLVSEIEKLKSKDGVVTEVKKGNDN